MSMYSLQYAGRNSESSSTKAPRTRMNMAQYFYDVLHEHQTTLTVERENRLGMELHRFHGKVAMADAHDDAIVAFRGDFKTRREASRIA